MEPVTALGLAVNIITVIDSSAKLSAKVVEISRSANGATAENAALEAFVLHTRGSVDRIIQGLPSNTLSDDEIALRDTLWNLRGVCDDIVKLLQKMKATGGSLRKSVLGALKVNWYEEAKKNLLGSLKRHQSALQVHLMQVTKIETLSRGDDLLQAVKSDSALIHDRLKKLQAGVQLSSISLDAREQIRQIVDISTSALQAVTQQRILDAIAFEDMRKRSDEIYDAHEHDDTFHWILQDETQFHEWLLRGDGIFHVSGKPGSGKSTLMRFLCEHPRTEEALGVWAEHKQLVYTSFFFWRHGTPMVRSRDGLIRSLLHQSLKSAPELIPCIFPETCKAIESVDWRASTKPSFKEKEIRSAFENLIHNAKLFSAYRFCFFIDGLDEFEEPGGKEDFMDLVRLLHTWTQNSQGCLKICVASRELNEFMLYLESQQRLRLHELTEKDIRTVVERRLELVSKRPDLVESDIKSLVNTIISKAEGVFLWVTLVLQDVRPGLINRDSIRQLEEKIDSLPGDLKDLFESILSSINPQDLKRTVKTLSTLSVLNETRTVIHSVGDLMWSRDHYLSFHYYLDHCAEDPNFGLHMPVLESTIEQREAIRREEILTVQLNGYCKGLVHVVINKDLPPGLNRYVAVTHRSVYDYLEDSSLGPKIFASRKESIASFCQTFLAHMKCLDFDWLFAEGRVSKELAFEWLLDRLVEIFNFLEQADIDADSKKHLIRCLQETLDKRAIHRFLIEKAPPYRKTDPYLFYFSMHSIRLCFLALRRYSLVHLAGYVALHQYVSEELEDDADLITDDIVKAWLLICTINGTLNTRRSTDHTIKTILEKGVSPNLLTGTVAHPEETKAPSVWQIWLQAVVEHRFFDSLGRNWSDIASSITELLLMHGAETNVHLALEEDESPMIEYKGNIGPGQVPIDKEGAADEGIGDTEATEGEATHAETTDDPTIKRENTGRKGTDPEYRDDECSDEGISLSDRRVNIQFPDGTKLYVRNPGFIGLREYIATKGSITLREYIQFCGDVLKTERLLALIDENLHNEPTLQPRQDSKFAPGKSDNSNEAEQSAATAALVAYEGEREEQKSTAVSERMIFAGGVTEMEVAQSPVDREPRQLQKSHWQNTDQRSVYRMLGLVSALLLAFAAGRVWHN